MVTVISVEHISKSYRLGQIGTGTLTNDLKVWWARTRGKPNPMLKIGQTDNGNLDGEMLWALKDVSFSVEQGEVLGIIGRNGAGKSTLLKILSRVTAPTNGCVKVKGRIASLLEVGTGFHPELTGRENIYLNGAILGMTRREIARKFDEIVDFAEIEKFIDTPVKRYSSGMYVRLAFAVAAHLESEILLVDEVLAVGDAEFQKKCLGKMGDVASNEGRTVLFVSHNMGAIQTLCPQSVLLENGILAKKGDSDAIVKLYMNYGKQDTFRTDIGVGFSPHILKSINLIKGTNLLDSIFRTGDQVRLRLILNPIIPMNDFFIGADLLNEWGQLIFAFHSKEAGLSIKKTLSNLINVEILIHHLTIVPGLYHFRVIIVNNDGQIIEDHPMAFNFEVFPRDFSNYGYSFSAKHGVIIIPFTMTIESENEKWQRVVDFGFDTDDSLV